MRSRRALASILVAALCVAPSTSARCAALPSLVGLCAAVPSAARGARAGERDLRARALLESGDAEGALSAASTALEYEPDDAELCDLASRAAEAAGQTDRALWYALLAARCAPPAVEGKKFTEALAARLAALDPLAGRDRSTLDGYATALFAIGQKCMAKKFYLSAVDVFTRARAGAIAEKADLELAKIYSNKKAVEALLDSGLDVPLVAKKKRSPEATAREDAKHATWETAHVVKGDNYTVVTNMGIDLAEKMSLAMEQMNRYYRKVFHVKERGGDTARVTIRVYNTRAEFDDHEEGEQAPTVRGFFRPGANEVATYDTSKEGFSPSFLWSTLFHEASHQFTSLIAPGNLIPAWLNEGTASYFEGARLLPNGTVETNLVPEGRLAALKTSLAQGTPRLEDVVSYFQPGSYDGSFYPFGWGLVYFLKNYEDDACERIYEPLYRDYMLAYKSGAQHDVMERFVEYFVTKVGDPQVASFADFEKRWKAWILALHDVYFGPPEKADVLLARARKQRQVGKLDAAVESYRWALRKRSDDPQAAFELADVLAGQKANDAAAFQFQSAIGLLRQRPPDAKLSLDGAQRDVAAAIALCRARIAKIDATLADLRQKADTTFVSASLDAARAYADAQFPLAALSLLESSRSLIGEERAIVELRQAIAKESGADPRRWRRLTAKSWHRREEFEIADELVSARSEGSVELLSNVTPPERYAFEAHVVVEDPGESAMMGLVFGSNTDGLHVLVVMANRSVQLAAIDGQSLVPIKPVGRLKPDGPFEALLGVDVAGDKAEFFIDGKSVAKRTFKSGELAGDIGLLVQDGGAQFREVRVRH